MCSYVLMCLTITGMQPYNLIDLHAPFSVAFDSVGLGWARIIVAGGALAGITTSLLGSLLGQARIYVTLGRAHLLPPWIVSMGACWARLQSLPVVTRHVCYWRFRRS